MRNVTYIKVEKLKPFENHPLKEAVLRKCRHSQKPEL